MLVGRQTECARIDALLDAAREGAAGTILLRGAAGAGKTSLLDYGVARADGMHVLRCVGIESEAELEFSGLLDLCRPLLDHLSMIAPVHAEAIETALGLRAGAAPSDRFSVGLATLVLVATCAEETPLLVVCDDLQWLDRSSVDALLFAVRRLEADNVATIIASRPEGAALTDGRIAAIELGGLGPEDALTLLAGDGVAHVAPQVAAWLAAETGGNPLALTELRQLLTAEQLAGLHRLDGEVVPGTTVEETFRRQVDELPAESRDALLLAALSLRREIRPVAAAIAAQGMAPPALDAAEDAGLISIDGGRFEFRHPLVRSAVVHRASPSARRAAHGALALAVSDEDPEGRAWHRSSSTVAPDESIAGELEAAAGLAAARGGFAGAAGALERAAELTPDPRVRLGRLLRAAEAAWQAGRSERAKALLREVLDSATDPVLRGHALRLSGALLYVSGATADGAAAFLEAADLLAPDDPGTAVAIAADAVNGQLPYARPADVLDAADSVVRLAAGHGPRSEAIGDVTRGHALCFGGRMDEGRRLLERGLAQLHDEHDLHHLGPTRLAYAFAWLGREDEGRRVLAAAVERARASQAIGWLPYVLATSGWHDVRVGHWQAARAAATEAAQLAFEVGQPVAETQARMVLMWLAALRGERETFEVEAAVVSAAATEHGFKLYGLLVPLSRGTLLLSEGNVDAAVVPLEEAALGSLECGFHIPGFTPVSELTEAYTRAGRTDDAEALLAQLARLEIGALPLESAAAARCRGLLASDGEFDRSFAEAIAIHEGIHAPFELARTHLCFGERLRRAGRRIESREELRMALRMLEELGAGLWAERARAELRASGETLRREAVAGDEFTPQELQIALQVAEGKTNREAAAALFLSPKTVEFHLGRVYRKLSISSRAELIRAFAGAAAG